MVTSQIGKYDFEGFGMVYLEANQFGCPVIAGNIGGVPDAVEHRVNGLLVDPDSIDQFCDAINKLADDQQLRFRLARNGIERIDNKYNRENAARVLEESIL